MDDIAKQTVNVKCIVCVIELLYIMNINVIILCIQTRITIKLGTTSASILRLGK